MFCVPNLLKYEKNILSIYCNSFAEVASGILPVQGKIAAHVFSSPCVSYILAELRFVVFFNTLRYKQMGSCVRHL